MKRTCLVVGLFLVGACSPASDVIMNPVTGVVYDQDGVPMAGAYAMAAVQGIQAVTDADGEFVLDGLEKEGMVVLSFAAEGYVTAYQKIDLAGSRRVFKYLTLASQGEPAEGSTRKRGSAAAAGGTTYFDPLKPEVFPYELVTSDGTSLASAGMISSGSSTSYTFSVSDKLQFPDYAEYLFWIYDENPSSPSYGAWVLKDQPKLNAKSRSFQAYRNNSRMNSELFSPAGNIDRCTTNACRCQIDRSYCDPPPPPPPATVTGVVIDAHGNVRGPSPEYSVQVRATGSWGWGRNEGTDSNGRYRISIPGFNEDRRQTRPTTIDVVWNEARLPYQRLARNDANGWGPVYRQFPLGQETTVDFQFCLIVDAACDVTDFCCDGAECMEGRCVPSCRPGDRDLCDGKDNDCDGKVDEDEQTRACSTACGGGTEKCILGGWSGCDARQPRVEVCNGWDEDCDQVSDNGLECSGRTDVENECTVGTDCDSELDDDLCRDDKIECSTEGKAVCPNKIPSPADKYVEKCNALDDDCDGDTDENYTDLGAECTVGVGECARKGTKVCKKDGTGTECSAVAGQPGTEVCDNKDNNCDGKVDESLSRGCSSCGSGTEYCSAGKWVGCNAPTTASEDCYVCGSGKNSCKNGVWSGCNAPRTATASCSICGPGSTSCTDGVWTTCDAPTTATESCSICGPGSKTCTDGYWGSCDAPTSATESCSISCGDDVTSDGSKTCSNGSWSSCSATCPSGD
ncbi:MAG: carboxypeptidase-like regulatory domain-containing protein [Pseudomonadota bacterium]